MYVFFFMKLRKCSKKFSVCFGILIMQSFFLPSAFGQVPGGSYQQSCQGISVQGNVLVADCRTRTGSLNHTTLSNFSSCTGDIWNGDGNLLCDKAPVPNGSYQQSCRDYFSDGTNLTGTCADRAGNFNMTTLIAYPSCLGDIWNGDGHLLCNRQALPSGSYQQSCRDVVAEQNTLSGFCKTRSGSEMQTSLNNFQGCVGDIWNGDGHLLCNRQAAPGGSYQQSCRDVVAEQNTLSGFCKTRSGSEIQTSLNNFQGCVGDIWNGDGQLLCNRDTLPPGSYQQSCRDSVTDGATLSSVCKDRAGREHITTLPNYKNCLNDITNMGGELHCSFNSLPPQGSYQQSCDDTWTDGTVLFARCKKINGDFQSTQLAFGNCSQDIANHNGVLNCSGILNPTTRKDYTKACQDEMGAIPPFNCLTGDELPITLGGVQLTSPGANCDNPIILGIHNESDSQCVPFARLLKLDTGNPNVVTVAICRKYKNGAATSSTNPLFNDIAIIQHNKISGNTCFHQSPVNVGPGLDGTNVPSPMDASSSADNYWLPPSGVVSNGCTSCHDADPFIQSPYIKQRADTSAWNPLGLYHPDFLGIFNDTGTDPKTIRPTQGGSPSECSRCHRIGVNSWYGIGNKIKKSMPPGNIITDDTQWYDAHKSAIDQINACVAAPAGTNCGSN